MGLIYCRECGKKISDTADVCVKCGASVDTGSKITDKRLIIEKKRKSTAIILAIFFGPIAWTYTWKFDKAKFWAGIIVDLLFFWTIFIPIAITIWAIIDMSIKDDDKFENYHKYKAS